MDASAESLVCLVVFIFLLYDLMRLRVENDRSSEEMDSGIVKTKHIRACSCDMLSQSHSAQTKLSTHLDFSPGNGTCCTTPSVQF